MTIVAPARASRLLRVLFVVHGVITLAAAVVLALFPALIPATVSITVDRSQYLMSYFLAAAELAVALLSIGAARVGDRAALKLIIAVFVVFHLATAALELVYQGLVGWSPVLVANVVIRIAVSLFFLSARRSLPTVS